MSINIEQNRLELERYKIDLDRYKAELDAHKLEIDKWSTGFNGILTLATLGIKSLILVNGAAVISLLTFIGNVIQNEGKIASYPLYCSMYGYLSGVAAAVICALFAFIFQVVEMEMNKPKLSCTLRIIAVTFAIISAIFFIYGSLNAIESFKIIQPLPQTVGATPNVLADKISN